MPTLPFTWTRFEHEIGKNLPAEAKARLTRAVARPGQATWRDARSVIVAPHLSMKGQTLWQCVEAVTLTRYPDGQVPDAAAITQALCYAAGIPNPAARARA